MIDASHGLASHDACGAYAVFASGIHAAHRPYELFLDPTDQPIKAELLTEAHCNWLRATNRVTHLDNLLPGVELSCGPFADCPCCAGMVLHLIVNCCFALLDGVYVCVFG